MANTAATKAQRQNAPRHVPEQQEQEDGGRGMKQDIGQMMAARMQTVELAVQHARDGRHGQPLATSIDMGEYPDNPMQVDPLGNRGVVVNINVVVVVDEIVAQGLPENGPYGQRQNKANGDGQPTIIIRLHLRQAGFADHGDDGVEALRIPGVTRKVAFCASAHDILNQTVYGRRIASSLVNLHRRCRAPISRRRPDTPGYWETTWVDRKRVRNRSVPVTPHLQTYRALSRSRTSTLMNG